MKNNTSLEGILRHVWDMLIQGETDKSHPFHFPALTTYGDDGIQQRTVILRKTIARSRSLVCYSDYRTRKIQDMQQHKEVSWLFYDHSRKEQIRVSSIATLHHQNKQAKEIWKNIPPQDRADYIGTVPPGTLFARYISNLPDAFIERPTAENTVQGLDNFCVISCKVYKIDYLRLMKKEHLRTQFQWQQGGWKKSWAAP